MPMYPLLKTEEGFQRSKTRRIQYMAKTREQKEAEVRVYTETLKVSSAVAFADLTGLNVTDSTAFRRKAEKEGVKVKLAKKTLLARAIKDSGLSEIDQNAFGDKAVTMLLTEGDQVDPARLLAELIKEHEGMETIGGLLDLKWMTAEEVVSLSKLPSRDELIAKAVGSIAAPLTGLVGALHGNLRNLVYSLNAIKESKS